MASEHRSHRQPPEESRFKWVLIAFILIAGYFLITEHRAHVIEYLPLALLFGCVFLHIFMHGGHGGHGGHAHHHKPRPDEESKGGKQ
ncbi:MAG: DUF2933 domain-containing protein [Pseudomonadota bacterium]